MKTTEELLERMRLEILGDKADTSKDDIFQLRLEDAQEIYLTSVYPFNHTINTMPSERSQNWQVRCAIELYNLTEDGLLNAIQYSENGLSIMYAKAGLSKDLLSELPPPRAGVPCEEQVVEQTTPEGEEEEGGSI